ncbi:hypothetical protein BH24PSE2_BH24PSE2_20950 [soil metagenome]
MTRKIKLLIVEDEAAIRTGLVIAFIYHGYEVEAAAGGVATRPQALRTFERALAAQSAANRGEDDRASESKRESIGQARSAAAQSIHSLDSVAPNFKVSFPLQTLPDSRRKIS